MQWKDQSMKKVRLPALALAGIFGLSHGAAAINLDDILLWSGSGTNRAALVVEWSSPEVFNQTTVPAPLADKTMVWGYRFNGTATGTQMLDAVLRADPRLYVIEDNSFGTFVEGIGYNLKGDGNFGLTDGAHTNGSSLFIQGALTNVTVDIDAAHPINPTDLYWGGYYGANWEVWTEQGDAGGFAASPRRGQSLYWTPDDPNNPYSGSHGQWSLAQGGLDDLLLTNGSWIGYSVAAGGFDYANTNDPGTIAYNQHKHAPVSPDGTYFAYVDDPNDFGAQVVASTNLDASAPYNDPAAVLGRPTLKFIDYFGDGTAHRTKIIEAPYWQDPNGSNVITEILSGGEITLHFNRPIYDNPNNPFGADFIIYGNSFFSVTGSSGFVDDSTDLNAVGLSAGYFGHSVVVDVSQDGANWQSLSNVATLFPDNAYRWDDANDAWTDETLNPTKPLNPSLTAGLSGGQTVAAALDQFAGACGGSAYDFRATGLSWIQYVRLAAPAAGYSVIDAVAVVKPPVLGDQLAVFPTNLSSLGALVFENPAGSNEVSVALNITSLNAAAKIAAVKLADLSPFVPAPGAVSSAFQLAARPATGSNSIALEADVSLRVGDSYAGQGADLRFLTWNGAQWSSVPFSYDAAAREVTARGLTNLTAFVVSQYAAPVLAVQKDAGGYEFTFTPQSAVTYTLERAASLGPSSPWTSLGAITATNTQPVVLRDDAPVGSQAFYRLRLSP